MTLSKGGFALLSLLVVLGASPLTYAQGQSVDISALVDACNNSQARDQICQAVVDVKTAADRQAKLIANELNAIEYAPFLAAVAHAATTREVVIRNKVTSDLNQVTRIRQDSLLTTLELKY